MYLCTYSQFFYKSICTNSSGATYLVIFHVESDVTRVPGLGIRKCRKVVRSGILDMLLDSLGTGGGWSEREGF